MNLDDKVDEFPLIYNRSVETDSGSIQEVQC